MKATISGVSALCWSGDGFHLHVATRNNTLTGDRFMILEIWSDNSGLPGTRLAGGCTGAGVAVGR